MPAGARRPRSSPRSRVGSRLRRRHIVYAVGSGDLTPWPAPRSGKADDADDADGEAVDREREQGPGLEEAEQEPHRHERGQPGEHGADEGLAADPVAEV